MFEGTLAGGSGRKSAVGLKWDQAEEIAEVLAENHPGLDPMDVRFTDLRQWVVDLDEFDDDPNGSNESKLEAIQMAWHEIYEEQGAKMQEKETLDEKLPGLFEPDTLLPIQYFEAMRRKHLLEGEKRLILSVLEDAIECFMKCIDSPTNKGQKLFRDAEEWIGLQDRHWVFSSDNVCEMLDIHPEYMRRGLRNWKENKLAQMAARVEQEPVVKPFRTERPAQRESESGTRERHVQLK